MTVLVVLVTILSILGWILAGLLTVLVIASVVPFEAVFHGTPQERRLRVTWLWGGVVLYPRPAGDVARREDRRQKRKTRKKRRAGETDDAADGAARRRRRSTLLSLVRDSSFRRHLTAGLHRLFRRIEIPILDIEAQVGLGDPADTGIAFGMLAAVTAPWGIDLSRGIGPGENHRVRITPLFDREALELLGRGRLRVVPARVVVTAGSIVVGPAGRQVLGALWRTRK